MSDKLPRGRVLCRTCGGAGETQYPAPGSRDPQTAVPETCWRCHGEMTVTKSQARKFGWDVDINQPESEVA